MKLKRTNSSHHHYPFGMLMPTRTWDAESSYRFGFQGQERDDEMKGAGNSYDFGARMYDSRLGRWFAVDPLSFKYPNYSPFIFGLDNPIFWIDPNGKEVILSDAFKVSNYMAVFTILNTTQVFSNLMSDFNLPNERDLNIGYNSFKEQHQNTPTVYGVTFGPVLNGCLIGNPSIDLNSDKFTKVDYPQTSYSEGFTRIDGRSDIAMARTLIHEAIHANLLVEGIVVQNNDNHHEEMASEENRALVTEGLTQFASVTGIEITAQELKDLSWGGLHDTNAFNNLSDDRKNEINKTLKKFESKTEIIENNNDD